MKGFIQITDNFKLNENVISEIKEYPDKTKIFTIYGEKYIIEKKENKNGKRR